MIFVPTWSTSKFLWPFEKNSLFLVSFVCKSNILDTHLTIKMAHPRGSTPTIWMEMEHKNILVKNMFQPPISMFIIHPCFFGHYFISFFEWALVHPTFILSQTRLPSAQPGEVDVRHNEPGGHARQAVVLRVETSTGWVLNCLEIGT